MYSRTNEGQEMKPNRTQKHICDFIIEQIEGWRDNEDIYSPTHIKDLRAGLNDIVKDDGWIDEYHAERFNGWLRILLEEIRDLKE